METLCSYLSDNTFAYGDTNNSSFCIKDLSSTSSIYSLETGSYQRKDRCNTAPMGQRVWFCVSFIQSDHHCFEEGPTRASRLLSHSDANIANPALVFAAFNDIYTETITVFANKNYIGKPTRPITLIGRKKVITVDSMEGFRKGLEMGGVSVKAAKVISDATREGSAGNHESSWGHTTINNVINFFADLFEKGL